MKHFVYVLNIKEGRITTAISFHNEDEAKKAWLNANREIEEGRTGVFHFDYTSDSTVDNDIDVAVKDATPEFRVTFLSLPSLNYPNGVMTHRIFGISEFEEAEKRTEEIMAESRYRQFDIQIMRYVKSALAGSKAAISVYSETKHISDSKPVLISKPKNKPTQPNKPRKNPTRKEHKRKILNFITKLIESSRLNEKVVKYKLA